MTSMNVWRAMPRLLGAASFAAALAWSSTAEAAPSCSAGETAQSFSYTGSDQTLIVPANVFSATVYLSGAQGADGVSGAGGTAGTGGLGTLVSGRMTLTPGETLTIGVGGRGALTVNPGGQGGTDINSPGARAGNGGGGTDIRRVTRVAIAGGGGGGGNAGFGNVPAAGGAGGAGGLPGTDGASLSGLSGGSGPFGGAGGTTSAGGAGGAGCSSFPATAGTAAGAGGGTFQFAGGFDGNGAGGGGGGGSTVGGGGGGGGVGTTGCTFNNTGGGGGGAGGTASTGTLTSATVQGAANSGDGSALICLSPPEFAISGTGSSTLGSVTLSLTGSAPTQTLAVPANAASFAFPTSLPDLSTWNVAVTAKPSNQSCTVTPPSGTLAGANVTNLVLACTTITAQTQSLTTVSGATATVSLEQGATGGPFTSAAITGNSNPAAGTASIIQVGGVQTLQFVAAANFVGTLTVNYTLSNATATTAQATVNITVNPSRFNVGGTGSSAIGPVTLQLTSTEAPQNLVVPANASSFTFPTGVLNNTAFQVAVTAKPSNQSCTVTPASGTVNGAAITNLVLACQTITAQNQTLTLLAGTTGTISLQTGATGGPFTSAAIVTPPAAAAGTASIIQVGGVQTLQFVAAPTFSGTTSLTFTLTGAVGTSAPATVTITVNPRPDPSLDAAVTGLIRGEAETARRFGAVVIGSFNDRLESLHNEGAQRQSSVRLSVTGQSAAANCAATNDQPGDLTLRPDFDCGAGALAAYADPRTAAGYAAASGAGSSAAPSGGNGSDVAFWLSGYVNFGSSDDGALDLDNSMIGFSGGVDYRFSPSFTAGVGLGYGDDTTDFGVHSSSTDAEAYSIAAYGSYRPSPGLYVDGLVGFSQLSYDSKRYVTQNQLTARGSRDGDQIFGSLSLGYEYRGDSGLLVATYGRLAGSSSSLDGFAEAGAGIYNLVYAEQTVDSLSGTLGLRLEESYKIESGAFTSRVRFEYSHDFEGSSLARLGYADIGLLIYQVDAPAFSRDYLTLGLGFDTQFTEGSTIAVNYSGSVGLDGDSIQHIVQMKLGLPF